MTNDNGRPSFLTPYGLLPPKRFSGNFPTGQFQMLLCLAALVFLAPQALAVPAFTNTAGIEFFEKKIRPLLVEHCYKCHSHASEKVKGGLRLDTLSLIHI